MKRHGSPITLFSFQDIITGLCGLMILLVLIMLIDVIRRKSTPEAAPIELMESYAELEAEIAELKAKFVQNEETLSSSVLTNVAATIESIPTKRLELSDQKKSILSLESRIAEQELLSKDRQAKKKALDEMKREQERIRVALESAIAKYDKNMITLIPERGIAKIPVYVECSGSEITVHRPLHKRPSVTIPYRTGLEKVFEIANEMDRSTSYFLLLIKPSALGYAFKLKYELSERGFNIGIDPLLEESVLNFKNPGGDQ